MARIRWRDFLGGLFLAGPRETQPAGTLRRAVGMHNVPTASLRSRAGSQLLYTETAHSLVRYMDRRIRGVGTTLVVDAATVVDTGYNGSRLSFIKTPTPTSAMSSLFVSGGGQLRRIDSPAVGILNPSQTGIVAPTTGAAVATVAANVKIINDCESTGAAATWLTASGTTLTSLGTDATIFTAGTKSTKMVIPVSDTGGIECVPASTLDLSTFASGTAPLTSPDEDWIALDMRFNRPRRVDSITIQFDVGDGNYNDVYKREIVMDDHVTKQVPYRPKGLADLAEVSGNELLFLSNPVSVPFKLNAHELMGKSKASPEDDSWASMLIPKSSFVRVGTGTQTWATVDKYKITVRTNSNGAATCYIDNIRLLGGFGLQGDYQYLFTFRNDTTGTRSNSNPITSTLNPPLAPTSITNVFRQPLALTGIPVSTDPQVTHVEIWRTVGGGQAFFYVDKLANGNTTYTDIVADYSGLHGLAATTLTATVLPTDNIVPASTFQRCALHEGRVWWTDLNSGKLYHSPPGRPEVASQFDIVTSDEDPLTGLVAWAGRLFTSSEGKWFEILGTDEPFIAVEVMGAPGCVQPFTIVPTPYGILYQSQDGIRRLDGTMAALLGFDAIGPVLRGESIAGINGFVGTTAEYCRGEYVISDGTVTLAYHVEQHRWRNVGISTKVSLYEPDTDVFVLSTGTQVLNFETASSLDDAGTGIPLDWETGAYLLAGGQVKLVQRLYLDILTNGQVLIPSLTLDDGTSVTLPAVSTVTRQTVVYPVLLKASALGVRLTGTVTARVELYGIEAACHIPESLNEAAAKSYGVIEA